MASTPINSQFKLKKDPSPGFIQTSNYFFFFIQSHNQLKLAKFFFFVGPNHWPSINVDQSRARMSMGMQISKEPNGSKPNKEKQVWNSILGVVLKVGLDSGFLDYYRQPHTVGPNVGPIWGGRDRGLALERS